MSPEQIVIVTFIPAIAIGVIIFLQCRPKSIESEKKPVADPERDTMPPGYTLLRNDYAYAYRRADGWVNHSFKTIEDCRKRAWEDLKESNFKDSEGNVYKKNS